MEQKRMTTYVIEELSCPKCGKKHSLRKYKTINVTEKAKMKKDILQNRVFQFTCDHCNYMAPLTYNSLYVDREKKLMIYMAPTMTAEVKQELQCFSREEGNMTRRLVDNINDLKEKIMIADNGLDDRMIEVIKIMYLNQIKKEMEDDTLMDILFDYSADQMCFLVFFQKKGIGKIPLTKEFYKGVEEKYRKAVEAVPMDSFETVNMEWAGKIFFKKKDPFHS